MPDKPRALSLVLFVFLALAALAFTSKVFTATPLAPWRGVVVAVHDGDTITVLRNGEEVKIRVAEVDCPERGQPYGKEATRLTTLWCLGQEVGIIPETLDRYGRTVAHVELADGRDLTRELILSGGGWWYRKYSTDATLAQAQAEARAAHRGLWSDGGAVAPWEWRE